MEETFTLSVDEEKRFPGGTYLQAHCLEQQARRRGYGTSISVIAHDCRAPGTVVYVPIMPLPTPLITPDLWSVVMLM